jgi:outer membrane protein OmpA-like peptidoglycan-associated protein
MSIALIRGGARSFLVFGVLCVQLVFAQAASDPQLDALKAAIDKARAEQIDALAPTSFADALEAYEAAVKDTERGRNPERIRASIAKGTTALTNGTAFAATARKELATPLRAREDAIAAGASKFAPEAWQKGALRFNDAAIRIERDDLKTAQRRGAESEVLLRDAELIAIKGKMLNEARELIAKADEAKVEKLAPRTLQAAKRYLAEADQEINRNRYDMTVPKNLAEQARYEARHALYFAELIQSVMKKEDDDQFGMEELLLSWEEPLKRIGAELEVSPRFDEGYLRPMQDLLEQVQKQQQASRRLIQEVKDRDDQIAALNKEMQRLEQRLGGVSEERIALQRRVDAQERLRANVAAIETSFTPNEARVNRQGDDVVISLLGIAFPSGRSTIDAASAPLLVKVRDALAMFPDAPLVVEGHTDSNGSDSANLILSQDRADAVKQYIVSNFGRNPERISSIGYGEARPVSTNETADGRARNRRIDLVIRTGAGR